MVSLRYVIKEDTRKRCHVFKIDDDTIRKFTNISLEQYHFLYEAKNIDFSIFVRVEDEIVEFIRPTELSKELLDQLWAASLKPNAPVNVCIQKKDVLRFHNTINHVRENKIENLIRKDPFLDRKTLTVFGNLSAASQMVVRGGINSEVAERVAASASYMVSNLMNNELAMATLSRMIANDPTLYDHSAAVAMFAGIMGTRHIKRPLTERHLSVLTQCGLYHDTGKSCVPSCVLNKPGSLTDDEWVVMKTHTTLGYQELVSAINQGAPIDKLVARVALEHHERMSGSGYPHGRRGRAEEDPMGGIHLFTRVISIADAYSALLMKRVYKPPVPTEQAIELLTKNAASNFDLEIFIPFIKGIKESNRRMAQLRATGRIYRSDASVPLTEQIKQANKRSG